MQAQTVRIHAPGGPDALQVETTRLPEPGVADVLIRHTAIGVNFIDIYHRTGLYKLPEYPAGLGLEAAGIVERAGEQVTHVRQGDRVAYCGGPPGAYASHRVLPGKFVVKLPDGMADDTAAALMLKGLTAHYLLRLTFRVQKGDTVLVHAAAGGVGLLVCQWAKYLGGKVLGTVSSDDKALLVQKYGCDFPIIYTQENLVQKVKEYTGGQGVDVVYDSVGQTTFLDSLDCLKRFGMLVSFGQSSGPIPAFDPLLLQQKGSLYLTRPTLMHHLEDTEAYQTHVAELFSLVEKKVLEVRVGGTYALSNAAQAHSDLEARKTTGALVLKPY